MYTIILLISRTLILNITLYWHRVWFWRSFGVFNVEIERVISMWNVPASLVKLPNFLASLRGYLLSLYNNKIIVIISNLNFVFFLNFYQRFIFCIRQVVLTVILRCQCPFRIVWYPITMRPVIWFLPIWRIWEFDPKNIIWILTKCSPHVYNI